MPGRGSTVPQARFKLGIQTDEITKHRDIESLENRVLGELQVNDMWLVHKNIKT